MSNQESTKSFRDQFSKEFSNLQKTIKSVPVEELRAVFVEDLDIEKSQCIENVRDCVDDLLMLAALGDPESIREVIALRAKLAGNTKLYEQESHVCDKQSVARSIEPYPNVNWRSNINEYANILIGLCKNYNNGVSEVEGLLCAYSEANFSFPLDCLVGNSDCPDRCTQLISDLCDRLMQSQFDLERSRVINKLAKQPAEDENLATRSNTISRLRNGPTEVTRKIFFKLDMQRTESLALTEKERKELENQKKELPTTRQLYDHFFSMRNDAKIIDGKYHGIDPHTKITADTETENRHYPEAPNSLARELTIQSYWQTRAALLSPLSNEKSVIQDWVDAAACFLICNIKGGIKGYTWQAHIQKRMNKTCSDLAGLQLFLREGFESLAGKDRKR